MSPGPGPRWCSPKRRSAPLASQPAPASLGLGASSAPSTPLQNRRARSGSSAGNSISGADTTVSIGHPVARGSGAAGLPARPVTICGLPHNPRPPLLVQSGYLALHRKQWFAEAARFVRLWLSDNHNREHDCDKRNARQHQCSTKRVVERTPAARLAYRSPVQTGSSELIKQVGITPESVPAAMQRRGQRLDSL